MKIAVIGGGASGLAAAIAAGARHDVTLFEKNDRVGKKLLVTGNGRCNLSNANITAGAGLENVYNSGFAADFARLHPYAKLRKFFEGLGLELECDGEGRVYPYSGQASSVLDVLRLKCLEAGVNIKTGVVVENVTGCGDGFSLVLSCGGVWEFDKIILCVGSGAQVKDYNGKKLTDALNLRRTAVSPALCPVKTFDPPSALNGTRVKCRASLIKDGKNVFSERGEVLFREYGLSGIAVFNLSALIARDAVSGVKALNEISLDLFPDFNQAELEAKLKTRLERGGEAFFTGLLTRVLGTEILKYAGTERVTADNMPVIAAALKNWKHKAAGLMNDANCQVMSGGVDLTQINPDMSVKNRSGLYVCGECLDADGLCGGYNLHFAFASGLVAGSSV